ncbi:thiamine pyrophosphate-binding protein [Parasulfuritortus cantonensis]|uniref:Thiamine pyrophosphate-binding protein n=1 Tax=Parasulfuritortus cantonensis TaxID=2528202 RepID=A0A4R1B9C3_9PROT|nr:thiamine pyrophosphate-binding protein [Parasulfuritortus cantonensis]TCJ13505.1 thiamine pyrophosphate-binding protein [Parasulfuritortus cantonensis]
MQIPVSQLIVRFMERLGVECLFGIPGAHILPVYDSLYDSGIRHVLAKHEQGAAFMAGGYARASGKVGACITTAGPGATNLVTGIANAYADKLPVLIVTGETPTYIFGKGGLQESSGEGGAIDQVALFKGITRYNKIVERTDYLENVLNQAAKILLSDQPGPVLLSFPYNLQKETVDDAILERVESARRIRPSISASHSVQELTDLLLGARRPVIVAGYGCIRSGAQAEVARLSETLAIPVTTSLKAKGTISEQSPLSLGSLGVTSSGHAYKYILDNADLVLFLGAGFNERTSYVWEPALLAGKRIAQIDNDFGQLEKVFKADLAINGDIKEVLGGVLARLNGRDVATCERVGGQIGRSKAAVTTDYVLFQSGFALVQHFFQALERRFPSGVAVFDDNIIFAQNFYNVSAGNRYYPNSGVSSLGHAIPAAIGARLADPRTTFAILGDGGFQMCGFELMTAVNHGIPLNVVVFNNGTMGLIRKNQLQHYDRRYIGCDFRNPDFELLARAFGVGYRRVGATADIDALFARDDLAGGINLIEIVIDKDLFPNYSSRR